MSCLALDRVPKLPAPPLWKPREGGHRESYCTTRLQTALCSKCSYADVARYKDFRNKLVYATEYATLHLGASCGHATCADTKHPTPHTGTPRRCRSHWICTVTVHQAVIDYNLPNHLNAHQHLSVVFVRHGVRPITSRPSLEGGAPRRLEL